MHLPLVALGADSTMRLDRIVSGLVSDRGWEERVRALPLEKPDPNEGLRRMMRAGRAIEIGKKLAGFGTTEAAFDRVRPLTELAAEFGLTLNQARMCLRLYIAEIRGQVHADDEIGKAEREAGIRDSNGVVTPEFRDPHPSAIPTNPSAQPIPTRRTNTHEA